MTFPSSLTDGQLAAYLTDGYLILRPGSLDDDDHRFFYKRARDLYDLTTATASPTAHLDHLGDNLRAQIPEIDRLLTDPVIDGALGSILGRDYLTHPHSYCHRSSRRDQIFHQDGNLPWNERGHYRSHRSDWAMLFYYPQDVDELNGPTEVVPGTQYWTVDHETDDGEWHRGDRIDRAVDETIMNGDDLGLRDHHQQRGLERGLGIPGLEGRFLHIPAGSVVLAHYDLVHRGSRTVGHGDDRYLYKFYFARLHEPETDEGDEPEGALDLRAVRCELQPVIRANWAWVRGGADAGPEPHGDLDALRRQLLHGRENEKVAAAYSLGGLGALGALAILENGLVGEIESTRRAAGHGLRQAGEAGLTALTCALESDSARVRRPAAAALGNVIAAGRSAAVEALLDALATDPDDLVRSNAAYSLGQMSRSTEADGTRIAEALLDRLEAGVEPDNAFNVELTRSTVRQSAAFALVQVLANHTLSDELIGRAIDGPLGDGDRYIQGLTAEGLARVDHMSDADRKRLVRYLAGRRWNPTPDPAKVRTQTG